MTMKGRQMTLGAAGEITQTALSWAAGSGVNSSQLALWINQNLQGNARHRAFDQLVNGIARYNGHGRAVDIFEGPMKGHHMTKAIIYLCGPVNGCTDAEANDWRSAVKAKWGEHNCVDPMKRDYRGKEAEAFREIVELDKVEVASCDVLLVNYDKPSVGSSMEILYAWERGKRVVVVRRPNTVISPWLRYHAHHLTHSFDAALAYIDAA